MRRSSPTQPALDTLGKEHQDTRRVAVNITRAPSKKRKGAVTLFRRIKDAENHNHLT